jgi:glyoxylase-like metal-dependent hydrolase (beta-lactamase superfamily II)
MIAVHRIPVPGTLSNTYIVVWQNTTSDAMVIDPGHEDVAPVIEFLTAKALRLSHVVLTHEHFDHIAGANPLRQRYASHLVCSRACAQAIGNPKLNMSRYLGRCEITAGPADLVCEDMDWGFAWGVSRIRMLSTPGHTPGSICVAIGDCLFTGDTLLENERTRTNLPGGDAEALRRSVTLLLSQFSPSTIVYPGHGDPFVLSQVDPNRIVGRVSRCLHGFLDDNPHVTQERSCRWKLP